MAAPPPNLKVAITIHVAFERTVLKYAGLYDDTVTVKGSQVEVDAGGVRLAYVGVKVDAQADADTLLGSFI